MIYDVHSIVKVYVTESTSNNNTGNAADSNNEDRIDDSIHVASDVQIYATAGN